MTVRSLRLALVGAVWLVALPVAFAQPPDPANDPLPKGAKVRYGVTRPILRTGPAVALLPPRFNNFLAPTMTGGIRRYDLGTGRPLQKDGIVGPGQVVVSADGRRAAVARPGTLTVVEVATGKELLAVEPPEGVVLAGVPGVSLSADGKVLAYGGKVQEGKGAVVVLDVDKNEVLAKVETTRAAPVYPVLSRDGKTLVTHGPPAPPPTIKEKVPGAKAAPQPEAEPDASRAAQVWEVATGKELFQARATGMGGKVVTAAFSFDGEFIALAAGDGPIDLWEIKTGKRLQTLLGRKGQGVRVAISPDGKTIASIGPDYRIQRWSVDGTPLGVTDPPPGVLIAPITALTFADNERVITWVTAQQFAVAWEAPTGKILSPEMDHAAAIRSIAMPAMSKNTFTSGIDGRVFRWDFNTGALNEAVQLRPAHLPGQPLIRPVVNLSADGTRASWLRTPAEIFDLTTGDNLFIVPPPSVAPTAVNYTLSPDGLKLITTSNQVDANRSGSCVVWDLTTQQRVAEFDIPASATAAAPVGVLNRETTRLALARVGRDEDGKQAFLVAGFDLKTGKKLSDVNAQAGTGTMGFAVANDTSVVIASTAGRVWSVDYANGKVEDDIDKIPVNGEPPLTGVIAFSPDGKRFAVGITGEQYTTYGVRVYDWQTKQIVHTFIGHAGPVTALHFTPDSNFVASGAQDTSVILWDLTRAPERK